jgi:hypothetical protein
MTGRSQRDSLPSYSSTAGLFPARPSPDISDFDSIR